MICKDCGSKNVGQSYRKEGEEYFEYRYRPSYKFWAVKYENYRRGGYDVFVRFGKIGTEGTTIIKHFHTWYSAQDYMKAKKNEKLNAGYQENY